ncbi:MAG TPA: hypothetical protein VMR33_12445 [Candidatus Baltobacteraceae bacterium]|jgi:hypothetical protein|nr:hypothetical protein [Candidatus Baltobacteraceae bacterium]
MTDFLLYFLICELMLLILWGFWKPSRVYQYPFLAGCVFALWAWPQFYRLHKSGAVPDPILDKALVMTILCSAMCYLGYQKGNRPIRKLNWAFNRERLTQAAFVLTLIGVTFQYKLSQIPEEVKGTQASGLPVLYVFLSHLFVFGFALSAILTVRRFSWGAFGIACLGILGYLETILFLGRREGAIQFALTIGMFLWFIRRKLPPRPVILCGIVVGAFVSYNIATYREAMSHSSLFKAGSGAKVSELKQMNVVTEEGTEMRNAAYYLAATETLYAFDLGVSHWSAFVWYFFPAHIFGLTAKENLMTLGGILHIGANAQIAYGYQNATGSTVGGITDAFASFWYFGCLEFFAIGYIMRRLYVSAVGGMFVWQLACSLITVFSLLAITHSTHVMLLCWVPVTAFLGSSLVYARAKPGEAKSETIPAVAGSREPRPVAGVAEASKGRRAWLVLRNPKGRLNLVPRRGRPAPGRPTPNERTPSRGAIPGRKTV